MVFSLSLPLSHTALLVTLFTKMVMIIVVVVNDDYTTRQQPKPQQWKKRKGKTKLLQHNILDDHVKREFSILLRGILKVKARIDDDSCMKKDKECFLLKQFPGSSPLTQVLFARFHSFQMSAMCEREGDKMTRSVPEQSRNGIRSPAENAKLTWMWWCVPCFLLLFSSKLPPFSSIKARK